MAMYYNADNFVSRFYEENVNTFAKEEAVDELIANINEQLSTHKYRCVTECVDENSNTYRIEMNFTLNTILDMNDITPIIENYKKLGWRCSFTWLADSSSHTGIETYRFFFQLFINHTRGKTTPESFKTIKD